MRPRLVCIVGPTAAGKTALSLEVAEALGAEIVAVDSRQVYRGMDVGTAKPTAAERRRVPHHCLDLADPAADFDVARYRAAALAALADIAARGRPALVVGGTGLWLRVLLRGLCPAPPRAPAVRAALRALAARRGVTELHRQLAVLDPVAASRIHPRDAVRLERALEVVFASGRRLSAWQAAHRFADAPYDALVVGVAVPAPELDARIAARAAHMVDAGFADEVRGLLARRLPATAPAWAAVGYREMRAFVEGECDLAGAVAAIVRATRRFAKRQRTWFRAEPDIVWRPPEPGGGRVLREAAAFLERGARPQDAAEEDRPPARVAKGVVPR
jgi:tRNA dimethylallyltransferase